ncbi:MAG: hypothetical protein E7529_07655 [Ruminococcaceae bacterium]|nr:hypothetical protein [Oscillospiraceae bacterium]
MTKKQFLRAIAFFLCVAVMVVGLCDLFEETNTQNSNKRFYKYRNLKEDTVDAVMVGTSGTDRYWIPSQAYEKYGMTVYPMSTNSMPVFLMINLIEEVYTHQNPELLIIDIRPFTQENIDTNRMDAKARLLLDVMEPFTVNRIKAALNTMDAIKKVEPDKSSFDLSLFFSFIKFHSRWSEGSFRIQRNMGDVEHNYLGFYIGNKMIRKDPQTPTGYNPDNLVELDPICEETLYELFDYIEENNLNVLFFDSPQIRNEIDMGRANTVYSILDKENYKYVHYYDENDEDGITIDFDYISDFYNPAHTNFYGATKFTEAFSSYLHENYDFEDHRNNEDVKVDWDGVQDNLIIKIAEIEAEKAPDDFIETEE